MLISKSFLCRVTPFQSCLGDILVKLDWLGNISCPALEPTDPWIYIHRPLLDQRGFKLESSQPLDPRTQDIYQTLSSFHRLSHFTVSCPYSIDEDWSSSLLHDVIANTALHQPHHDFPPADLPGTASPTQFAVLVGLIQRPYPHNVERRR